MLAGKLFAGNLFVRVCAFGRSGAIGLLIFFAHVLFLAAPAAAVPAPPPIRPPSGARFRIAR